ncbi:uncharacterized protein A4U43_C07F1710 [Asparagus officinalis]|uniref:Uncharacterized protein n=1 Tax=Asparagus officinalis TaxID=4686 RepID=A0A5P1EDJ3_ASPOF|nr:uncharacterized protein A4U43_C07F1710 [Asparagus officinalis]
MSSSHSISIDLVGDKLQLVGKDTQLKDDSRAKNSQDFGEETGKGIKGTAKKSESAESNSTLAKKFDQQVMKNRRTKRKRGNRYNRDEDHIPIGFV